MGSVTQVSRIIRKSFASITRQANTDQYAAGDVLSAAGTSPANYVTFSRAANEPGGGGRIVTAQLIQNSNQSTKPHIDLFLFSVAPATDFGDDNEAFALADADIASLVGVVTLDGTTAGNVHAANPASDADGNAVINAEGLGVVFQCEPSDSALYGIAIVRNTTYDPLSADVFKFVLGIEQ